MTISATCCTCHRIAALEWNESGREWLYPTGWSPCGDQWTCDTCHSTHFTLSPEDAAALSQAFKDAQAGKMIRLPRQELVAKRPEFIPPIPPPGDLAHINAMVQLLNERMWTHFGIPSSLLE